MRRKFGVILQREAIRQSRRWQTYALRFAFAGLLVFLIWYALDNFRVRGSDAAALGHLGRGLFMSYISIQLAVVCFVAPLLVAAGILEEREAKTLDLLAISGLGPQQILNGKVGSRLLVLLTIIASGAPILALIVSFGGTSTWQVINATVNTAVLAIILGVIGGFCALFAKKGPIPSLIGAMLYIVPPIAILPYLFDMIGGDYAHALVFSPLEAIGSDHPAAALVGLLYVPIIWQVSRLSLPVFRIATSDESTEEFGLMSPDFWVLERFKRRTWLMLIACCAAWLVWTPTLFFLVERGYIGRPSLLAAIIGGLLCWFTLFTGTRSFLMTWMWGAERVRRHLNDPTEGFFRRRRRKRRAMHGNPVAWRELSTRSSGGMRLLVASGTTFWLFLAAFNFALNWDWASRGRNMALAQNSVLLSMLALFLVFAGAMLITTATVIDERLSRTLPLLLLTPMSRVRIVGGKLMAVWWRALPLIGATVLLFWLSSADFMITHSGQFHTHRFGPNVFGSTFATALIVFAWLYSALTTHVLAILLVGLLVRPVRLTWPAIPAVVAAWWFGPWVTMFCGFQMGLMRREEAAGQFLMTWFPFTDQDALLCDLGGMPVSFLIGTTTQIGICVVLTFLIRLRLNALLRIDH